MKNGYRRPLALLAAWALLALPGMALAEETEDNTLGIVTGATTGTYFAFGKDIATAAAKAGIEVDVKPSEGSIDNIKRINSAENAAVGIVQSDVLGFLSRSKSPESKHMARNLRMIFPFYNEEVHVLARGDIKSFADLQGKRIAIGDENSGNMLTAINLLSMMNVVPEETLKISSTQSVVEVLKGDLDAAIFVGGKPVRLFKNLEDLNLPENQKYAPMLEQVHFLPLDDPRMLEEYKPAHITHADYSFVHDTVPTIAVQAVLVSYDFSQAPGGQHCDKLARLARAIREDLPELKEKGHPKWKEVDLNASSGVWKRDACAWPKNAAESDPEKAGLLKILEKGKE